MPRVILWHGHRVPPETIRAFIDGCKSGGNAQPGRYGAAEAFAIESAGAASTIGTPGEDAAEQHAPGKTLC